MPYNNSDYAAKEIHQYNFIPRSSFTTKYFPHRILILYCNKHYKSLSDIHEIFFNDFSLHANFHTKIHKI